MAPPTPASAAWSESDIDLDALLAAEPLAKFPGEEKGAEKPSEAAEIPVIESLDDDIVADLEPVEEIEAVEAVEAVEEEPIAEAEPVLEAMDDDIVAEAEPVEEIEEIAEIAEIAEEPAVEHVPIHHLEAPLPVLGAEASEELVEAVEEIDAVEELEPVEEPLTAEAVDAELDALFADEPPALDESPSRGPAKKTDRDIDLATLRRDNVVAPAMPTDEEIVEDVFLFEDDPPAKK